MVDLKEILEKNDLLLEHEDRKIRLSQRHLDCIKLLLTGATSKEIARQLDLSYRTIEDYINVIKLKFNVRNKSELILKLSAYFKVK